MAAALEIADLRGGYGRIEVLRGLDLVVPEGAVVALLGANGVGKTTTLRAITGSLDTWGGEIRLRGDRIDGCTRESISRRGVILVPEGRGVFPGLTVEENLRLFHDQLGRHRAWADCREAIVGTFPRLGERLDQLAGTMSGGEQQMLAVSRAMVAPPGIVLFDELSMGLAPVVVEQLFDHIDSMRAAGSTIVLVEQFLTHALALADVCYVLARGQVVWAGEPAELRAGAGPSDYLSV